MDSNDDVYSYFEDVLEELYYSHINICDSVERISAKSIIEEDEDELYYSAKDTCDSFEELSPKNKFEEDEDTHYYSNEDTCDNGEKISAEITAEEEEGKYYYFNKDFWSRVGMLAEKLSRIRSQFVKKTTKSKTKNNKHKLNNSNKDICDTFEKLSVESKTKEDEDKHLSELSEITNTEEDESEPNDFNESYIEEFSNMSVQDPEYNHFKVLSIEEIVKQMDDCLTNINTIFQIPKSAIRIILNYLDWDVMEVAERLSESKEKLFKEAGLVNREYTLSEESSIPIEIGSMECKICFSDVAKMIELNCGHQSCEFCWREYLTRKIMVEGSLEGIVCMSHKCGLLVDDEFIMRMVPATVRNMYQQLIINTYLKSNNRLTLCPASDCSNFIQLEKNRSNEVTCLCGKKFCFSCNEIWHDPIDCQLFKKWLTNCSEERGSICTTRNECPNCLDTNLRCGKKYGGYEFCWNCSHTWYSNETCECEKNKESESPTEPGTCDGKSKEYYYNIYKHHSKCLISEEMLLKLIITNKIDVGNTSILGLAVKVLGQCRQTLMVTYALAFYLEQNDANSMLFVYNQNILEEATDRLVGYLNEVAMSKNINDYTEMFNGSLYCADRRQKLVGLIREGFDKRWWKFSE